MNINVLKKIDGIAGRLLAASLPAPRPRRIPVPRNVLFIRPGGIGDAVLLVPALRALKTAFPGCAIDVLAERRNAAVFSMAEVVRHAWCYDEPRGLLSALRVSYDVVIDTEQWYRLSAVVARLCRAARRVGFAGNERSRLFTDAVPYRQDAYEAESFLSLLTPLGVEDSQVSIPFLRITPDSAAQADALLAPLCGRPFVSLFPGASIPEKRWEVGRFREVAAWAALRGYAVVVVGGGGEAAAGEELVAGLAGVNLAGRCSLPVTAAVVARGAALVSGDSGVLHLACGVGTPTVSLFGPSSVVKWAPKGARHVAVSANLDCAPCSLFGNTPPCPGGARCLSGVEASAVIAALEKVLEEGLV